MLPRQLVTQRQWLGVNACLPWRRTGFPHPAPQELRLLPALKDGASTKENPDDPHQLNLISETGLYTLVLRSRKPAAIPFQRWVTAELLPSIRRGDTDLGRQHARMAETLAEAVGRRLHVLADIEGPEAGITVLSDGTVHCRHGRMEWCVPEPAADSGPPYGPYFRCAAVERVGIGGSRALRPCGTVKFADVVRWSARTAREGGPEARDRAADVPPEQPAAAGLLLTVGDLRVQGSPEQIARVLRELGVAPPRSR
jgi:hypothetical protein